MSDWKTTTLGKIAQVSTGFPFKSNDYSDNIGDIKLLRGDNIAQGTLRWDNAKKWSKGEYEKYAQYQLQENDVVLAMDRPWIDAGLKYSSIRKGDLPSLLVQRTARLRGSSELDVIYLKYIIASPRFSKYIQSINTGSLVPHISSKQIKDFPVNLPPMIQQKKISSALAAIDKKIDLNNRINTELEAIVKTLYDYWFVQFDFPDANGKPYKTSGGKMVYNSTLKREIPAGWEPVSVGKIVDIKTGKEDANYATESGKYHFFTCGESALRCDGFVFEGKAVLLAGNGSFSVKRYKGKFNAYQRTYVLIPKKEELYAPLYFAVHDKVKTLTSGSRGSIIKFITKGDIEDIYLPLPINRNLSFVKMLNSCFNEASSLYEQNLELVSLRDWLLPMLMNGQVTIK
ncbi:restriction endonuclease subunit S [Arsenophonus apicola]|uniref:Restriction endonuclease subunit S n=1 Tax=Arsenophonus apicola TaxID=2879119 RepID=A0ABY8P687_9GAMM|nr:restriction endonuclease subunit S [Arsenophonus apicola]WGO83884.1 restriction endonuclease subunit S [Arsenophonus apicola]